VAVTEEELNTERKTQEKSLFFTCIGDDGGNALSAAADVQLLVASIALTIGGEVGVRLAGGYVKERKGT
jgi:hypothetical protein